MLRPRPLGHITTCCSHVINAGQPAGWQWRVVVCIAAADCSRDLCVRLPLPFQGQFHGRAHQTVWVWQSFPHPVLVVVIPRCWNSSGQSCEHGSVQSGFLFASARRAKCRWGLSCQAKRRKVEWKVSWAKTYSGQERHEDKCAIPAHAGMFGVRGRWSFAAGLWRRQHVPLQQQDAGLYQNQSPFGGRLAQGSFQTRGRRIFNQPHQAYARWCHVQIWGFRQWNCNKRWKVSVWSERWGPHVARASVRNAVRMASWSQ